MRNLILSPACKSSVVVSISGAISWIGPEIPPENKEIEKVVDSQTSERRKKKKTKEDLEKERLEQLKQKYGIPNSNQKVKAKKKKTED